MKVKRVIEKWEIQEEEVVKSEKDMKKLVPSRFHKQIKVFGRKVSEKISVKMWDHVIKLKKGFVLRKGKRGKKRESLFRSS